MSLTAERVFDESKHPRDPGGEGGGQWIKKGTSGADEGVASKGVIPDTDDNQELIDQAQKDWRDSLSVRERQVINIYSQTGYLDFNAIARGEPLPSDASDHWYTGDDALARATADEAVLRKAVSRAELPEGAVLYRKTRVADPDLSQRLQDAYLSGNHKLPSEQRDAADRAIVTTWLHETMPVGSEINLTRGAAYISTSARGDEAANFNSPPDGKSVLFRVSKPKRGAYIEPFAKLAGESEVLVPPGVRYRVKRIGSEQVRTHRDLIDQINAGEKRLVPITVVDVEEVSG